MDPRAPVTRVAWRDTARLIPSRYPSTGLFDRVSSPDEVDLVMDLEGWTNDRLSAEAGILRRLPRDEWVIGRPMASVVMAAFCHPHPLGSRFAGADRGAWYAARRLETSIAEAAFHRRQEFEEVGVTDARVEMRLYRADFRAEFHDLRGGSPRFAPLLATDSYEASQAFAAQLLAAGSNGVLYPSVRHAGGECLACFRPKLVQNVRAAAHFVFEWRGGPDPRVTRLKR